MRRMRPCVSDLSGLIEKLQVARKPAEALVPACQFVFQLLGRVGGIGFYRRLGYDFVLVATLGDTACFLNSFTDAECLASQLVRTFISDGETVCPHITSPPAICVPLLGGGQVVGILVIQSNAYSSASLVSIEAIARHVGLALWLINEIEDLRRDALTDKLTGLVNRSCFDVSLQRESNREVRMPTAAGIALAVVDVDGFKEYNDTCGHPAGDKFLAALGSLVREQIRKGDLAARLGGDEFGIIFVEAGIQQAYERCEQIRQITKMLPQVPFRKPLTLSIGVAHSHDYATPQALVDAADRACYVVKNTGRDRVVLAPVVGHIQTFRSQEAKHGGAPLIDRQ
jgi:diguanylate cyclase (GGDEF)-like protein